jgi:Protein of unknown function (DUF3147)
VRFVAGGLIVSLFAVLGDVLRPKSFAGLFGAAPSVALATFTPRLCQTGFGLCSNRSAGDDPGRGGLFRVRLSGLPFTDALANLGLAGDDQHARRLAGGRLWPQTNPDRLSRDSAPAAIIAEGGPRYEYVIRVVLGGATTVVAGLIADHWGPSVGGLFLAFPAILCASATLVEAHERREKRERHVEGHQRGTDAAGLETAGAVLGSLALALFALAVWLLAPHLGATSLAVAAFIWLLAAITFWRLRRKVRRVR